MSVCVLPACLRALRACLCACLHACSSPSPYTSSHTHLPARLQVPVHIGYRWSQLRLKGFTDLPGVAVKGNSRWPPSMACLLHFIIQHLGLDPSTQPREVQVSALPTTSNQRSMLQAILYSFPAICWLYGAGLMFSSFASLVFWGQPAAHLYETLKTNFTIVHPVGLQVCPLFPVHEAWHALAGFCFPTDLILSVVPSIALSGLSCHVDRSLSSGSA